MTFIEAWAALPMAGEERWSMTHATVQTMWGEWSAREHDDGVWGIIDPAGDPVARLKNARIMALHLAVVMEENARLRERNDRLQHEAHLYHAVQNALAEEGCAWPEGCHVPTVVHDFLERMKQPAAEAQEWKESADHWRERGEAIDKRRQEADTPPITLGNWSVQCVGGVWTITDPSGKVRGRYADARALAERLAMAFEWLDRLRAEGPIMEAAIKGEAK